MFSEILLTVDFDRTLTAPDTTIPQRNLEAIAWFMANGGTFTVNTGRSVPMTRPFLDQISVNAPLLLYNGSAAYDPATGEISQPAIIATDMWQLIEKLQEKFPQFVVEIQGVDAHYCTSEDQAWAALSQHNRCAWGFAKPGQDLGPFLKLAIYGEIRDVTIAHLFEGTAEEKQEMDNVQKWIEETFGDKVQVFRAAARILDLHAPEVSKGRAARNLQKRLGKKYLVCVGDGENDVPMLDEADFSYCPADGVVADRYATVCPCAEGAVADVIYKKLPEILKNDLDN